MSTNKKANEIFFPTSVLNCEYDVYSTMREMKQAYYYKERDRFLKHITSRPRRKRRRK